VFADDTVANATADWQITEVIEDLSGIPIGSPPLSEVCGELPPLP
jgi:hypothetical protein